MTKERLQFNTYRLDNGIRVSMQTMDVPLTFVRLVIPVGNAHSNTLNLGGDDGIAHLLEHMCFERSELFTDKHSFEKLLISCGGDWNATTNPYDTHFFLQVPSEDLAKVLPGFLSHIFKPTLDQSDLALQTTIIENEKLLRKYYPGEDEVSNYKYSKWMEAAFYPKDQLFGSSKFLKSVSIDQVRQFHQYYLSNEVQILVGGTFDESYVLGEFAGIETSETKLTPRSTKISWNNKDFHTANFNDIDTPIYIWGGFSQEFDLHRWWGVSLITHYLTDSNSGVLTNWIRKEKGWSYGPTCCLWFDMDRIGWTIDIPMNDEDLMVELRQEIHAKTVEAIQDSDRLNTYIKSHIKSSSFAFQTLEERMNVASDMATVLGRIPTENEYERWLLKIVSPTYLMEIYNGLFSKDSSGEFLALPISTTMS